MKHFHLNLNLEELYLVAAGMNRHLQTLQKRIENGSWTAVDTRSWNHEMLILRNVVERLERLKPR